MNLVAVFCHTTLMFLSVLQDLVYSDGLMRKKRGRKRKIDKLLEQAAAAAAAQNNPAAMSQVAAMAASMQQQGLTGSPSSSYKRPAAAWSPSQLEPGRDGQIRLCAQPMRDVVTK